MRKVDSIGTLERLINKYSELTDFYYRNDNFEYGFICENVLKELKLLYVEVTDEFVFKVNE